MTPAQREQLNRFLAEKVMGWTEGEYEHDGMYRSASGIECFVAHWNPLLLLRDCTLLLDKIEQDGWEWSARKVKRVDSGAYYEFALTKTIDAHLIVARSESRTEALCLAIAKA